MRFAATVSICQVSGIAKSFQPEKHIFKNSSNTAKRGVAWTVEEHRLFLRGLAIYGRGDWRSIARNCVITRTSIQVASHAQKYFNRLKAVNKENRGMSIHDIRMSIHDITIVDAEVAGTSLVPYTEGMIWPACGGSQAVASTSNQSMLPAEQMIAVAGGESSGHGTAFVSGMNSMSDEDDFILHIDDLIVDPEDANESKFPVDGGRSQLPSKQPCTACSSGTNNHPIFRVGSELEALITKQVDVDYDFTSIFQFLMQCCPMLLRAE
ncbi:transcription factor DIVARICATA [Capsicum chacoense]